MREQIGIVVQLQEIEIKINKIKAALEVIPEKMSRLDKAIRDAEQGLEMKKSLVDELKKKYRLNESDYQANLSMLGKSQEKLAAVKTNKEYQSILKEIDDIKAKNSRVEDEMLKSLDVIEITERETVTLRKEFLETKDLIDGEKEIIGKKIEQSEMDLAELDEKRGSISKNIDKELMLKYNIVKGLTKGTAIAPALDSICRGCDMNIPPQMYNDLQRFDSIKFCPHCQRIIYWGKA
ncbi:MAG: hypothetical protein KKH97_03285 [Proteobacteria bacterium]|nr:hypothetical protein [Pseudomonadota bacterium]